MPEFLYITADKIGAATGGGLVTFQEQLALQDMGSYETISREILQHKITHAEPWGWDYAACQLIKEHKLYKDCKLAHFYSGTFSNTVQLLKQYGIKICYTIAAHDRAVSKREHEQLGVPFPYPHLVENDLWHRYIEGYRLADVIICPGTVPCDTVKNYGEDFAHKTYRIVPHGCTVPKEIKPLPSQFVVGYMGSLGLDKGVRYLLEAWKKLNYSDALLVLAGRDTCSDACIQLVQMFGGGNIYAMGWVGDVSDFYNRISLYIQPSATEGSGLEVIEALAHGRPVLCSDGAGARDMVPMGNTFPACNVDALCEKIKQIRYGCSGPPWEYGLHIANKYNWDKVRSMYQKVWKEMLR